MTTTDERALTVQDAPTAALSVFGTDDPVAIVERVGKVAGALGAFIRTHGMSKRLESAASARKREERGDQPPKEYVFIDGWSFAGQMLNIAAVTREMKDLRDVTGRWYGAEARVELVTRSGQVVGGAIAECTTYEERWAGREAFQVKSMAQTRAVGKAFRTGFGFVMQAAGFESTPGEEFVEERDDATPRNYGPATARPREVPAQNGKRNGVAMPTKIESVGELLQAARFHDNLLPDAVAALFEVAVPGDLAAIIGERFGGDYLLAWAHLRRIRDGGSERQESDSGADLGDAAVEAEQPAATT